MKQKTIYLLIATIWLFMLALLSGSIIILSINSNYSAPSSATTTKHNGWWLIKHEGLWNLILNFKKLNNQFAWWYDPQIGIKTSTAITTTGVMLLISVVPIFSIIFGFLTWRLFYFLRYPKSIKYIDAIKLRHKTQRQVRKKNRQLMKLLVKNQINKEDQTKESNCNLKLLEKVNKNYCTLRQEYLTFKKKRKWALKQKHLNKKY